MTSSTEWLYTNYNSFNHTYVKEEIIISDGEDSGIVLDSTGVYEENSHLQSTKKVPHKKKTNSSLGTKSKPAAKKNVIRVKNGDKETELLDLDTFPATSLPSLIRTKELIDKNGRSTPELPNNESQEDVDFDMAMATLDDYCSLLDIPDASENSDREITECWIISDSEPDADAKDGAAVATSFNSNQTLDSQIEDEANTDVNGSLMQTSSKTDEFATNFYYNPTSMGEKKRFFYEVCIICKIKQSRQKEMITKNCQKCNASTSFQCLLCSAAPYHSMSSIYMHIVRVHQQENVNLPKVQCPRCNKFYLEGRPINDHLRRCKVEPHLLCSLCKTRRFHQKHHLKAHIMSRHFDEVAEVNAEDLVAQIILDSESRRVNEQMKAELRYGGKVAAPIVKPFPISKFTNGYCPKCDELFPPQPDGARMAKNCRNCNSQLIYQCVKCQKRSFTRNNMRFHLITKCARQSYSRLLRCDDCDFTAPHKNIMRIHVFRTHMSADPSNRYKCRKCDKSFKIVYDRNYHEKGCGNETRLHKCVECHYQSRYRYRYLNHVRLHLRRNNALAVAEAASRGDDVHMGNQVASVVKFEEKKPAAEVLIRTPIQKPVVKSKPQPQISDDLISRSLAAWCPRCKLEIACTSPVSRWHVSKCKSCQQSEFVYRCKRCSFKHLDTKTVVEHVVTYHARKSFDCAKNCGSKFRNVKDLSNHEQICGKVFRCRFCSYAATDMNTIRRHVSLGNCGGSNSRISREVAKSEGITSIDVEDVKDVNLYDDPWTAGAAKKLLNFHHPAKLKKASNHAKKQLVPYTFQPLTKCSKCDKFFKNMTKLMQHQQRCGNNFKELFHCDHCSFKTNVKATLESHIQSKHGARLFRGVDAFHCDFCPKVFKNYFIYYKHTEECRYRTTT